MVEEVIDKTHGELHKNFIGRAGKSGFLFQSIAKKAGKENISAKDIKSAREWFRSEALNASKKINTPSKLIATAGDFERVTNLSGNSIGKMYLFNYDAKHKDTLPYWDRYPIIFPIEYYSNGSMLAINLHYLPPLMRAKLMNELYDTLNNEKMNKTTKMQISYSTLKSASRFKLFKPCVKKYLFSHVKSPFTYIKPEFWDYTALLPLSRFAKAGEEKVWQDSMEKINA